MPIKILLIEDNTDHVLFTKRALKNTGKPYELDAVGTGKEALSKITEKDYDLILCDFHLPDSSALDVLRKMREEGCDLPFVVVTSAGSEKIAVELMKEGAYDYLTKDLAYQDTLPIVIERSIERYAINKEKKELEEKVSRAAEEWETTFNSITDLVSIHDKESNIVKINSTFAKIFNMKPEEIIGKKCYELFHCVKEPRAQCPHNRTLMTGKAAAEEFFEPKLGIYVEVTSSLYSMRKVRFSLLSILPKTLQSVKKQKKNYKRHTLSLSLPSSSLSRQKNSKQ